MTTGTLPTSRKSAPASMRWDSRASGKSYSPSREPRRPSTPARFRKAEATTGWSPSWSARCASATGRRMAESATRSSWACGATSAPRSASARRLSRCLRKTFWPADAYTKGDLVAYYDRVAPLILPYFRDRPLVLTRYPDGITGKSFFQKDAPEFAPAWVRTERVYSKDAG